MSGSRFSSLCCLDGHTTQHRAMNGTTAVAASSPKVHSRQASATTAPTAAAAAAPAPAPAADDAGGGGGGGVDGVDTVAAGATAAPDVDQARPGKEQGDIRIGEIPVDDDESIESGMDRDSSKRGSRSRGNSVDSSTAGGDAGGGTGRRLSGGGSVVTDASMSMAGDASVGGESVLLWEDSDNGKGTVKANTSPRVQLRLQAANGGFATTAAATEEQATAMSAAAAAAEAAETAAMAKAAAEAAGAAFDAEAAAGIRPLGGRQGAAATEAATEEAQEGMVWLWCGSNGT